MEAGLVAAAGDLAEDLILEVVLKATDLAEDHLVDSTELEAEILKETADLEDQKEDLFRCMMQLAVNVESNVRFHSDQQEAGQSFAAIVSEKVMVVQAEVQEMTSTLHQIQEHLRINSLK